MESELTEIDKYICWLIERLIKFGVRGKVVIFFTNIMHTKFSSIKFFCVNLFGDESILETVRMLN